MEEVETSSSEFEIFTACPTINFDFNDSDDMIYAECGSEPRCVDHNCNFVAYCKTCHKPLCKECLNSCISHSVIGTDNIGVCVLPWTSFHTFIQEYPFCIMKLIDQYKQDRELVQKRINNIQMTLNHYSDPNTQLKEVGESDISHIRTAIDTLTGKLQGIHTARAGAAIRDALSHLFCFNGILYETKNITNATGEKSRELSEHNAKLSETNTNIAMLNCLSLASMMLTKPLCYDLAMYHVYGKLICGIDADNRCNYNNNGDNTAVPPPQSRACNTVDKYRSFASSKYLWYVQKALKEPELENSRSLGIKLTKPIHTSIFLSGCKVKECAVNNNGVLGCMCKVKKSREQVLRFLDLKSGESSHIKCCTKVSRFVFHEGSVFLLINESNNIVQSKISDIFKFQSFKSFRPHSPSLTSMSDTSNELSANDINKISLNDECNQINGTNTNKESSFYFVKARSLCLSSYLSGDTYITGQSRDVNNIVSTTGIQFPPHLCLFTCSTLIQTANKTNSSTKVEPTSKLPPLPQRQPQPISISISTPTPKLTPAMTPIQPQTQVPNSTKAQTQTQASSASILTQTPTPTPTPKPKSAKKPKNEKKEREKGEETVTVTVETLHKLAALDEGGKVVNLRDLPNPVLTLIPSTSSPADMDKALFLDSRNMPLPGGKCVQSWIGLTPYTPRSFVRLFQDVFIAYSETDNEFLCFRLGVE